MLVIQDGFHSTDLPQGGIAAIGNFDGIHRGQRQILERVVECARERRQPAVVITFEPHTRGVLRPESAPLRLTTPEQKRRLLEELGLDAVVEVRFTPEFATTPAQVFVREFLHQRLGLQEIHVGRGFAFGYRREGDLDLLRRLGAELGFEAFGVEEVTHGGLRISSTRIRQALEEGEVAQAQVMLGRPYGVTGRVVQGDRMGQRLGWPTINVEADNELLPANGVYAGRVAVSSFPDPFECVTNIGTRPTLYENYQRVMESHILRFSSDVYGERVEVFFYKRLREERIFPTVMDLSAQIGRDVEATREYFAAHARSS